eukprot:8536669-Alexandrium_andersonii.AAC.1
MPPSTSGGTWTRPALAGRTASKAVMIFCLTSASSAGNLWAPRRSPFGFLISAPSSWLSFAMRSVSLESAAEGTCWSIRCSTMLLVSRIGSIGSNAFAMSAMKESGLLRVFTCVPKCGAASRIASLPVLSRLLAAAAAAVDAAVAAASSCDFFCFAK